MSEPETTPPRTGLWSPTLAEKVEATCRDFESVWQAGGTPSLHAGLWEGVAEADRAQVFEELLALEVQWRRKRGESPRPASYHARFPHFAAVVDRVFGQGPAKSGLPSLPGYEVLAELGRGAMGKVYRAVQFRPRRPVALKVIRTARQDNERLLARFRAEAEALAALNHPHIVQVYEVGEHQGLPFFSMEYVEGGSLADRLAKEEAARLAEALARAVQSAHDRNIIHRDLKPSNILLAPDGKPKVTDFGLAKRLDEEGATLDGEVLGTPGYMAPELIGKAREAGPATDVYSLGAVLYELLTGRSPFKGTLWEVLRQVRDRPPEAPHRLRPDVPRDLEAICLKCLEKDPGDRYPTAGALAADLWNFLHGMPTDRPTSAWRRLKADLYFKNLALAEREWSARKPQHIDPYLDACPPELRGWEWYCLRGMRRGKLLTLAAHEDVVYSVCFRHDGKCLASISDDQTIRIWDVTSGECVRILSGHTDQIYATRFSADGTRLVGASQDGVVRVWDLETGEVRALAGHEDVVVGVDCSPEGYLIASASDDTTVRLWDGVTGELLRVHAGHGDMVNCVAFDPTGRLLASGSYDETVRLWDVASGNEVGRLAHASFVWTVAFSPDGRRLASGGGDGTVRVWDVETGEELHRLVGHGGVVWSVAFCPDGERPRLASAGWDKTVRLWDTVLGREAVCLRGHRDAVNSVAFSPDGKFLASGSDDRTVVVWPAEDDPGESAVLATLRDEPPSFVHTVAFHPSGGLLASAHEDRKVRIWDVSDLTKGKLLRGLSGHSSLVTGMCFSADGSRLASASADKTLRIWDPHTGDLLCTLRGHTDRIYGVAFSPDGRWLASAGWDRTVRLWDVGAEREVRCLTGHTNWVWSVAFSPDGRRLASASTDWTVRLWDLAGPRELVVLRGHTLKVQGVCFSPDGTRLASASSDQTVKVWDVAGARELATLHGHTDRVYKVAFSPDGQLLASASEDQTVKVWDAATWQEVGTLGGHTRPVNHVAFHPGGKQLASASDDGTIKLWEVWRRTPGADAPGSPG
jgi:WD40 repeat protein/predicted Ser/Thr protein kinase